jgi:4-amino-4-deoxy-L-arabinose transferase-like glycosyltransferase
VKRSRLYVILLLVLLLATGLRLYRLEAQSFWNDEGNAARAAERSIPLILDAARGDIHPPGYYLLLHAWRSTAGESEFALRALSAFCGVLTVALTYVLGRRLLGAEVALGGAFLAAVSPLAVYYSQEARMYALLGMLAALSTYLLIVGANFYGRQGRRAGDPPQSRKRVTTAGYILTLAAGLFTQYAFPFIIIVHNLLFLGWCVCRVRELEDRWRIVAGWILCQAAALLLYLPWLPIAVGAVTSWPSTGSAYTVGLALLDTFRVLTVGITLEIESATLGLGVAGLLLITGLVWATRRRTASVATLTTWLVIPVGLIFAFNLYRPAYLKFFITVLPAYHLLLAHGIESTARLVRRAHHILAPAARLLLLGGCLLGVIPSLENLYHNPDYARDDYRGIAADIAAAAQPGDGIILNAANQWEVFTYYHREGAPVYPLPRSRPPQADEVYAELEGIAAAHDRLFVLYWGDVESDPDRLVEGWLATHAYKAADRWVGEVRVATYGLGPLAEVPTVALEAEFDQAISLSGYTISADTLAPGDILPVSLFWEAGAEVAERYKVFLQLLDESGQLVAQVDTEPRDGLLPTSIWPVGETIVDRYGLLLDLPPGEYTLIGGLYHLVTGERLPVTVEGEAVGDFLTLETIVVSSGEGE